MTYSVQLIGQPCNLSALHSVCLALNLFSLPRPSKEYSARCKSQQNDRRVQLYFECLNSEASVRLFKVQTGSI